MFDTTKVEQAENDERECMRKRERERETVKYVEDAIV